MEDTIRDFWATRPRRSDDDRKIGGVAAAIGRRYDIDPVLVRVAFVVATFFGGAGVLLYLLGWLLLPAKGDEVCAAEGLLGRGHSSMSSGLTLVLGLALIPMTGIVFGGHAFGVLGLAAGVATIFFLHRGRATLGEIPTKGEGTGEGALGTVPATQGTIPATQDTAQLPASDRPAPPAWDPLGVAPFAWDLPEPTAAPPQAPPPARRPRSKVTPITLGLALLVGGLSSALWPGLALAHVAALVLGAVGIGLVVGSLVRPRAGRVLIVVAVPLALLTWVLNAVPVSGFSVGQSVWAPVTATELQPHYDITMGEALLDLSGLRMAEEQLVNATVAVALGQVRVVLPPHLDVEVVCRAPVGTVDCLGVTSSGSPARAEERSTGADGPGGGTLVLDVRAGMGQVQVTRGFVSEVENG
ncbi:MAG: PspC domain-containing protein [Pseudonocardiales bacterium]